MRAGIPFRRVICYVCGFFFHTYNKFKIDLISTICVLNFQLVIPVSFSGLLFQFLFKIEFFHKEFPIF